MRLLTVTHFYASHGGGIERVAGHLCREMMAAGHQVEWAASQSDPPPSDLATLPLRCVNPTEALTGLPMPIPGWRGIRTLIGAVRRADAVIVHDALYVTSVLALLAARWCRRPVVLVQHIAELQFTNPVMRHVMKMATALVTRPMLRAATRSVFISEVVRQSFATVRMRGPALLFNGVDTSIFHARKEAAEATAFREKYDLSPCGGLVAFVGRFVSKKGLAVLREVAASRPDLTFALAGSGPIDPASWGLGNVRILGPLDPADVASLLRCANWLLLPSVGEGYPLVVQEALACGLPVICGLDSAAADPEATGWLYGVRIDHADPIGTAARIAPLLSGPQPASRVRDEMAAYASQTYSWPATTAALVEICAGAAFPN